MAEYIEKQAAIDAIDIALSRVFIARVGESVVSKIPPADVRPVVRGKWIRLDMHRGMEQYKCSACRSECYVPECMGEPIYCYCPTCGSDNGGYADG